LSLRPGDLRAFSSTRFGKGSFDEVIVVSERDTYAAKGQSSLLAFLLARYPQLGTLQIVPQSRTMRFGFFVKGPWDVESFTKFGEYLGENVEAMVQLAGRELSCFDLRVTQYEDLSMVEIDRDMGSITPEEIALIVALFEEQFNMNLMSSDEDFQADHLDWDDGVVQHVLEDINREVHLQEWLGFREDGRILVFCKPTASGTT
jgi:hypothetical protein